MRTKEDEVLHVFTDFTKAMNTADFELLSSLYWHSPKTSQFIDAAGLPFLYQGWEAIENNYQAKPPATPGRVEKAML